MKVQLIRNATLKIQYGGKSILVDPMLCPKDTFPPFVKGLKKNPTNDLVMPIAEILNGVEGVMVTHSHPDHFDELSKEMIPKDVKLFCTPVDKDYSQFKGFSNKTVVDQQTEWDAITIRRVEGQHGSGPILPYMGKVSGYLLQHKNEPTLYIVSDSILTEGVKNAILEHKPDIIICNSGGGILPGFEKFPVMLDEKQTIELVQLQVNSRVIAVHLEAIDFCRVTRKSLRIHADKMEIPAERLLIPKDGDLLEFKK